MEDAGINGVLSKKNEGNEEKQTYKQQGSSYMNYIILFHLFIVVVFVCTFILVIVHALVLVLVLVLPEADAHPLLRGTEQVVRGAPSGDSPH